MEINDVLVLIVVGVLVSSCICAIFCRYLAKEKGYTEVEWAFLGFFFGIFALIAVAGLPNRSKNDHQITPVFPIVANLIAAAGPTDRKEEPAADIEATDGTHPWDE